MYNKGQITIFILIGIIILVIIGMLLYLVNSRINFTNEDIKNIPADALPIKNYFKECIEERVEEVVQIVALQGGYFGIPDYPLEYGLSDLNLSIYLPYYLYNYENTMISKIELEQEISHGIELGLSSCMNFSMFNYNIEVDSEKSSVHVLLESGLVISDVIIPIEIQIGDSVTFIEEFNSQVETDLYDMYYLATNITNQQMMDGGEICISCLSYLANQRGYYLDMTEIKGEESYVIIYTLSNPDNNNVFNFAHKFNLSEQEAKPVTIDHIDELNATIGYVFEYGVNATGKNLFYRDDTDLFEIDKDTGLISFSAEYVDSGSHTITIEVEDAEGYKEEEIFTLNIEYFGSKPIIEYIGYLETSVGELFTYTVNATSQDDLQIIYLDDSDLFNIDSQTGIINFIPVIAGEYSFNITVIDKNGNSDVEEGFIIIK